jgi:hypothetical protein
VSVVTVKVTDLGGGSAPNVLCFRSSFQVPTADGFDVFVWASASDAFRSMTATSDVLPFCSNISASFRAGAIMSPTAALCFEKRLA